MRKWSGDERRALRLRGLDGNGEVRIGAMMRHRELLESELLQRHFPIVADAERIIADPVVRNWGTAGGALCQADPSEDLSAGAAALDAAVVIKGRRRADRGDVALLPRTLRDLGPRRPSGARRRRRPTGRVAHASAPRWAPSTTAWERSWTRSVERMSRWTTG